MKSFCILAITIGVLVPVPILAQGDIAAVNYTGGGFSQYAIGSVNNGTIGWVFSLTQDITISSLGWLNAGPPSAQTVSVGLWSIDGTLLGSAVVNGNSVSSDGNFYQSISPVFISAGSTVIIAVGASGQRISFACPPPSLLQQNIQYAGWAYTAESGFTYPTPTLLPDANDPNTLFGATFLFQIVPEPNTLSLFALSALFLGWRCRKTLRASS